MKDLIPNSLRSLRLLILLFPVIAITLGPRPGQAATVMILYFDNHSSDRALDPLGKGLADMLITDLSGLPELQVVEREKLEAVLKELQLQRSEFFDPRTAQKIGAGLGAQYGVMGAFTAAGRGLRMDVRVVRIETGEVIKTAQASGERDRFLDLQQQLTGRLIEGLGPVLGRGKARQAREQAAQKEDNRVADVDLALGYGRALDLMDRGEFQAASGELEAVVGRAPGFVLGRTRYLQALRAALAALPAMSPADRRELANCRAVTQSRLLCGPAAPGGPPAEEPRPGPAPRKEEDGAQRARGGVAEIGLQAGVTLNDNSYSSSSPFAGTLFGGYKLGRFLFGLGLELSYASAVGATPTPGVGLTGTTGTTTFRLSPGVRVAFLRLAEGRLELIGAAALSYGYTDSSATHHLGFTVAPGPRFWIHPRFAVSALGGLRGDFGIGAAGTNTVGLFAALQGSAVF